jgi:hypothetical protein
VWLRVTTNDLVIPTSRSTETYPVPSSPLDWRTAISMDPDARRRFTADDRSDVEELRRLVRKAQALTYVRGARTVDLKIEWPLAAVDEIISLYERYEREGKKVDDEFPALAAGYKPPGLPAPYTQGGELARPYEEEPKSAQVFREKDGPGLRNQRGKVVLAPSRAYTAGAPLQGSERWFAFSVAGQRYSHVLDARGRVVTVGTHKAFVDVQPGPQPGTWRLVGVDEGSPQTAYTTTREYTSKDRRFYTQADFDAFVSRDRRPAEPPKPPRPGDAGKLVLAFATSKQTYYRGTTYVVDARMQVLSKDTAYY